MYYLFLLLIILSFCMEKEKLFENKKNLGLFIFMSVIGIVLGIIHMRDPYIRTLSGLLQSYWR